MGCVIYDEESLGLVKKVSHFFCRDRLTKTAMPQPTKQKEIKVSTLDPFVERVFDPYKISTVGAGGKSLFFFRFLSFVDPVSPRCKSN